MSLLPPAPRPVLQFYFPYHYYNYNYPPPRVTSTLFPPRCQVDYTSVRRHAPSWHPDGGSVLALPVGAEGEVVLLERLSWEPTGYLSGEHSQAVNVVAFSPNGGSHGCRTGSTQAA